MKVIRDGQHGRQPARSRRVIAEITDNNRNRVFKATQIMDIVERPARDLPDPNDLVDIETAWRLPDRPNSE